MEKETKSIGTIGTAYTPSISATSAANGVYIGVDTTVVKGTLSDYTKNNTVKTENNQTYQFACN